MSGSWVGSPSWITVVRTPLLPGRAVACGVPEVSGVSSVTHSSCHGGTSPTTLDRATREYGPGQELSSRLTSRNAASSACVDRPTRVDYRSLDPRGRGGQPSVTDQTDPDGHKEDPVSSTEGGGSTQTGALGAAER